MQSNETILEWIERDASGFFEWLATRPWYRKIHEDWIAILVDHKGNRGLEIGCGPGLLTHDFSERGWNMTGLDRSQAMVTRARRNAPGCVFVDGDALALPFSHGEFDLVLGASVVNVVSEPDKLVREMMRVTRSGGLGSVLFPTPRLVDEAISISEKLALGKRDAEALGVWGSKAPKREAEIVRILFEQSGWKDLRIRLFFDDTVAAVEGIAP